MRNFEQWTSSKSFETLTKFQCALCIIIYLIVHKYNITQTDDHQSACDQNQYRSTTGFQTFDTVPFILSLKRTTKKVREALRSYCYNS